MPWTREAKLDALVRLPWTVDVEQNPEEGYYVVRARELSGAMATGSAAEVEQEFWESLRETLACLLDFDDPIPLPASIKYLPWEVPPRPRPAVVVARRSVEMYADTVAPGAFATGAA